MKTKKIIITSLITLIGLSLASLSLTFAWFMSANDRLDIQETKGGVITQYFHCGDGSENDPFVITRPVHLYNMTELYDKLPGFAAENYHFQLGYDLENNGNLEFYSYGDDGKIIENSYTDSLNMSYYESLRPIGSEEKPFGGIFDGSNLTIDNLTISGDGVSDIGFFGYVTEEAEVKDLYLDNLDIDTTGAVADAHDAHDTNAYVGYLAGHIDNARSFTNTYVNNCKISGQSVLTKNEWGYYGHCENAATIEDFIMRASGENAGWGGSVNMQKMYDRLYDIADQATTNNSYAFEKDIVEKADGTTFERDALTGYAYTYRSQKEGSFVFSRYSANAGPLSSFMYLNGGTRYHQIKQTETTSNTGFTIRSGNGNNARYLGIQNGAIANVQTGWFIDSSDRLAAYVNDTLYFLNHSCQLVSDTTDTWTKSTNTIYYTQSNWFWNTNYYLTYRNNRWQAYDGNATLTLANATVVKVEETSSGADYMDYSGTNVTYFPLITAPDSYEVARKNTGYVIGGSEDNTTAAYPDKTGDIRVSKYSTSDISNSYRNGTLTNVYTINSSLQRETVNPDDYIKYSESKTSFLEAITDGNIYGLHFMPANININHLVNAEYTLINGEEKTNYEMPASSIDFNVVEKGCINFFAGTYFSGNNSFFSLHHIERDTNDKITSIQEIAEIYKSSDESKDYIYKYTNGSYTASLTSDYSLVFSTNRIKKQNSVTTDAVYYFEIPVNAGEFALGSVDGGTGAYLMYLDIASNGGIDQHANVDTFGSVEYRSAPDVAENSILLITYEQQANQTVNLTVAYIESEKRYNVNYSGSLTEITITVLSTDYKVYYNGNLLEQAIKSHTFS